MRFPAPMRVVSFTLLLCALACGPVPTSNDEDAGQVDAGLNDAGEADAGRTDAGELDAGELDAGELDAGELDAGQVDAGLPDAGTSDAGIPRHWGFAKYTIPTGAHSATIAINGASRAPLAGLTSVRARTYQFIFDATAMYELTNPAQPGDQLDWNKLPGLSDCGQFDLARDGLMFAWRWRLDTSPRVLEIAHYANNAGTHLYPTQGLIQLDESELRSETALTYELEIAATEYRFHLFGTLGARVIDERTTFPRRCTSSTTALKWASGFYFGGTSTAPQPITGFVQE